ncbi:hypothetical protein M8494_10085 [Serratia ureilytica]
MVGGMTLPNPPGGKSFRSLYTTTAAPGNETPFYCSAQRYDETYRLQLPANVPIIAIPQDRQFRNAAGDYRVALAARRAAGDRQSSAAGERHPRKEALCQAQDYPAFRAVPAGAARFPRPGGVRRVARRQVSRCPPRSAAGPQSQLNSPATSDLS